MRLQGIEFGPVFSAAGAQGFFGEKYLHQKLLGPFGPDFDGCTFVAKTTTWEANKGNMPMKKDGITPKDFRPKCIMPNFLPGKFFLSLKMFLNGIMLNSVGLSGPGAEALFEDGRWQEMTKPFGLSFMSTKKTADGRIDDYEKFVKLLAKHRPKFKAPVFLQENESCPNVGLDLSCLIGEVEAKLKIGAAFGIIQMPKFNILAPIHAVREITRNPHCAAICTTNTIHWNDLPKVGIDRKKLFGTDISPLAEFGGGALSGKPLFPLVVDWIRKVRFCGIKKPINAGGGILSPNDLTLLHSAEASSVFIGSAGTLRPRNVKAIIEKAHQLF